MTDFMGQPAGYIRAKVRWQGHRDPRDGWSSQEHEMITVPVGEYDGDPMLHGPTSRPVGRVLARTLGGKHGLASYLSSDAMFTRYEDGFVFVMDRKSVYNGANPPRVAGVLGAGVASGKGKVEAGPDGKRPWTLPFVEFLPTTSSLEKNIAFMGPDERKLMNPYCITVRGSSFGIDGDLLDNFAFPEDHHHITDHRGAPTGFGKPNDRRSTRWYDINQAGMPSRDEVVNGRTVRGYNQNSDRIVVVHRDAGGCAGGDPEDMNLAFNFSGRTGFAYGLVEMKAQRPFYPPVLGPTDPKKTSSKPGGEDEDRGTYATTVINAVLATMAYERGGFLSPGHASDDKHKYATNYDGLNYNPGHIHINAKFTNESIVFDGRRNMIPAFEPPVGRGLIPVRSWEMFNKDLADPFFCEDEKGGWDFHTRINSIPIWPTTPPTVPPTVPPPTVPPPITPTPPTVPPTTPTPPGTPRTPGTPETPTPPPVVPGTPITPTPPHVDNPEGEPGGDGRSPITPTPPSSEPPTDWGPAEIARPSIESHPRPGNTEDPETGGSKPRSIDDHFKSIRSPINPDDIDSVHGHEATLKAMKRTGVSEMDMVTVPITGVTFSDHMKSPKGLHLIAYYRHKYDAPVEDAHGLPRWMPEYTKTPVYKEGRSLSEPAKHTWGTARSMLFAAPPELKSHQARHDQDYGKVETLSQSTLGLHRDVTLGFGLASTKWDEIVSGFRIGMGDGPDGNYKALRISGVDADGDVDSSYVVDVMNDLHLSGEQVHPNSARWQCVDITYAQVADNGGASTTATLDVATIDAGYEVLAMLVQVENEPDHEWSGGEMGQCEIELGTETDPDKYSDGYDLFGEVPRSQYSPLVAPDLDMDNSIALQAKFTADVNLENLTQGQVKIWYKTQKVHCD